MCAGTFLVELTSGRKVRNFSQHMSALYVYLPRNLFLEQILLSLFPFLFSFAKTKGVVIRSVICNVEPATIECKCIDDHSPIASFRKIHSRIAWLSSKLIYYYLLQRQIDNTPVPIGETILIHMPIWNDQMPIYCCLSYCYHMTHQSNNTTHAGEILLSLFHTSFDYSFIDLD